MENKSFNDRVIVVEIQTHPISTNIIDSSVTMIIFVFIYHSINLSIIILVILLIITGITSAAYYLFLICLLCITTCVGVYGMQKSLQEVHY